MLTEKWETIPQIHERTKLPIDQIVEFIKHGHNVAKTVECQFDSQAGVTVCEWRKKSN